MFNALPCLDHGALFATQTAPAYLNALRCRGLSGSRHWGLRKRLISLPGRCRLTPSEQGDRRCPDYDLILPKLALQEEAVAPPPRDVQRFRHDFEYDDLVVHRLAAFRGGALGGRAGECSQSAETLRQMLADFGVFLGPERLAAVVMEGQKYLDLDASRSPSLRTAAFRT